MTEPRYTDVTLLLVPAVPPSLGAPRRHEMVDHGIAGSA